MNTLYKYHMYLDKTISNMISANIKEYDIKAAGFNMLISAGMLSDAKIEELTNMPKKQRNIYIGNMIRANPELGSVISEKLTLYRKRFVEANNIADEDILSIKKDAIVVINHPVKITKFDNVQFIMKNKYSSYFYINKFEFYYGREGLDIKGLNKDAKKIHDEYILSFIKNIFKYAENSTLDVVRSKIYNFSIDYINYKLDPEYYRQCDSESLFIMKDRVQGLDCGLPYAPKNIKDVDISYNYMNYIVPLIRIFY